MKVFIHDKKRYFVGVILSNLVLVGAIFAKFAYELYHNFGINFNLFMVIISAYVLFNTIISKSYPNEVFIGNNAIAFKSFGVTHSYYFDQISKFEVKALADKGVYVRINKGLLLRGRYFVKTKKFSDGGELHERIYQIEEEMNPQSVFIKQKVKRERHT